MLPLDPPGAPYLPTLYLLSMYNQGEEKGEEEMEEEMEVVFTFHFVLKLFWLYRVL